METIEKLQDQLLKVQQLERRMASLKVRVEKQKHYVQEIESADMSVGERFDALTREIAISKMISKEIQAIGQEIASLKEEVRATL